MDKVTWHMSRPSADEAMQFAVIMRSGVPALTALQYFLTDEERQDPEFIKAELGRWMKSPLVSSAQTRLMGKKWQDMNLEERIQYAIDKHYAEIAYYLYSHNYAEASGFEKTKADTCRQVLEAKLAGIAGKLDPLERFLSDFTKGKFAPGAAPVSLPSDPPKAH